MDSIRRHAVSLAIVAIIALVSFGLYLVERQRAVVPNDSDGTWTSGGGYVVPAETTVTPVQDSPIPPLTENDTISVPNTLATNTPKGKPAAQTAKTDGSFDFNALIAALKHETAPTVTAVNEPFYDAFENLAKSLVQTPVKKRTAQQEALFAYGNKIGAQILAFRALHSNDAQTKAVSDQATHRSDPSKAGPVKTLGGDYRDLGEAILAIKDVPEPVIQAHQQLGESYVNLGNALSAVPDATGDQDFIAAITAYNAKADAYITAFTSMATMLSSLGVTFSESDAGAVFSFRSN